MAELVDALESGSSDFFIGVQVPLSAPQKNNNEKFLDEHYSWIFDIFF